MSRIQIIGGHGMGDCLLALQCAQVLRSQFIEDCEVAISSRLEVFEPLSYLFGESFTLRHLDEKFANDNALLKSDELWNEATEGFNESYYVIPDLLFNNKKTFPYKKYHSNPQHIRSVRLLDTVRATRPIIYLGLLTTTAGYEYAGAERLAINLANKVAALGYKVYFPTLTTWAGKAIKQFNFDSKPENLIVDVNPDFCVSLEILKKCQYFVGTDNGPSHVAYHLGIPRLILDPQYNRLPWISRWREDYTESIPLATSVNDIVNLIETNLKIPQTTLIPRMFTLLNANCDWHNTLLLKTE